MKSSGYIKWLVGALAGVSLSTASYASTVSSFAALPWQGTNWTNPISIAKFDPALGTLNSITFELDAGVNSTIFLENRGSNPATVTSQLVATISLQRPAPDLSVVTYTASTNLRTDNLGAWDGLLDYDGASGETYLLSNNISSFHISPAPTSDLVLFTGLGNLTMQVTATVTSQFTGPGNVIQGASSGSSATVKVTYDYSDVSISAIPAPAAVWTGGVMLLGLIVHHYRRRSKA